MFSISLPATNITTIWLLMAVKVTFLLIIFTQGAFSLNCMVGTGDMWEVPKSASDIKKGNYPTMDAPFKSYKCGERGSQIAIIDTMIKNVTDNIVQGWNAFTEAITNVVQSNLDADRSSKSKRQVEGEPDKTGQDDTPDVDDDNYACVKVVLGRTAYRSCVPKYSEIRLNCTTVIGKNAVCYCHTDDCNGSNTLKLFQPLALLFISLFLATI